MLYEVQFSSDQRDALRSGSPDQYASAVTVGSAVPKRCQPGLE